MEWLYIHFFYANKVIFVIGILVFHQYAVVQRTIRIAKTRNSKVDIRCGKLIVNILADIGLQTTA